MSNNKSIMQQLEELQELAEEHQRKTQEALNPRKGVTHE